MPSPQDGPAFGVVCDVDGVLTITHVRRQWGRVRALLNRSPRDRRSVLGMPHLVRHLAQSELDPAVFYLTAAPDLSAQVISEALDNAGYPTGTTLTAGGDLAPGWLVGRSLATKRAALDRLADQHPHRRWILLGDDAGADPELFAGFARRHPGRVAVIALRQDRLQPSRPQLGDDLPGVRVVAAPNAEEMLPSLNAALGLRTRRHTAVNGWFLTAAERGNDATLLRAWTTQNAVRPLVHGCTYFGALAEALAGAGAGDVVLIAGWRADADELLTGDGPTVAEALTAGARRGALVRALLWRAHLDALGYHLPQNRHFATTMAAAGVTVLLDQRIRALGSHHQKAVVIRYAGRPAEDVAFVGGIDLDRGSRDGIDHRGDPQPDSSDDLYGPTPARHDLQLEVRGPAVREIEEVFRERWADPAPVSRLPWHVVSDLFYGTPRTATPLPEPFPDPPAAGPCAVQLLRTYPRRRPAYPFAPMGERSVARAYAKALRRARRLIYLEDQYLWSVDVARIFAAALRRSPQLHLIAVVPRRVDQKVATRAAEMGQLEAMAMVRAAGGDRVQIFDIENDEGRPIYIHAKVCVVDDVWAVVGSNNLNNRSWTHDSELAAAVIDDERDPREPLDPGGLGDGARLFARRLRLDLMREHLALDTDEELLDPDRTAATVRERAATLEVWHTDGRGGQRPPGRLRPHVLDHDRARPPARHRWLTIPAYRIVLDPDGRPPGMRLRRAY
ncbi:phosphatase domain-containing protein [Mycobacterium sp. IS-1742]|uniref:phosphatase domain-containing protein n=1 Tax=Mycobacterium sp. IS-1742 TaxID=1772285 RepID=UPI000B0446A8|nr:phosphatase domain-containing protein [Mycobacterium sp. IS-1742]